MIGNTATARRAGSEKARLFERVVEWIWDHRNSCLAACIVITLFAAMAASRIQVDNAIEIWFPENDETLAGYRDFQSRFGSDEVVVAAFDRSGGILNRNVLKSLYEAGESLGRIEGVARVVSIATVAAELWGEDWLDQSASVFEDDSQGTLAADLHRRVLAEEMIVGRLISGDGKTAAILIYMDALSDIDRRREKILAEVEGVLQKVGPDYHMAGIGVIHIALNRLSTVDSRMLMLASNLVIAFMLRLVFGRFIPVLVSLSIAAAAVIWLMGLYAFTGHKLDMVTMIMPSLVTIIGIANCIHILRHAGAAYGNGDRKSRVVRGVGFIVRPCLFNTLTTSAGFAALLASPMPVIRSLGLFSAAGLLIVFLLSVVVCIWALQWECAEPTARPGLSLHAWAVKTASLAVAHPVGVLTAALIVTAAAAWGAAQVNVDTYSIQFLKPDHRVRRDYAFIEKRFGGYMPMEFVLHSDNGILRGDVVRQVADWQNRVEARQGVGWSFSVADLMASGVFVSVFPDADFCENTSSRLWSSMIDCPNEMRVSFGIPMQSARQARVTLEKAAAQACLPDDVTLKAGAYLPLYVKMIDHIVGSQINSFALAFVVVFAAIGMFFRSWRYLLIAIPANLLPVLFTLGVMGWLGVRLDVATVVIAAVVLGIVVDDTILLLYHLRHQRDRLKGNGASILAAAKSAGTSMVMTTLVLSAGLVVYGFAEINSIVWFGLLISLTMLVALAADLLIVPALSVFILPKTGSSRVDLSPSEK